MKKLNQISHDLKLFIVVSLTTAVFIFLCSLLGHFITPGKLIPYAMAGGSLGILIGIYILYRRKLIGEENVITVSVSTLITFGISSLIIVFNFDKPLLIFFCFLFIGLTTAFSNRYFEKYKDVSASSKFGLLGAILIFPTFYFIVSNILKFGFGVNGPFNLIDGLLKSNHGQANFNVISPFIFAGGLTLAFIINLLVQIQFIHSNASLIKYKLIWTKVQPFNFALVLVSCILGSILFTYLLLENWRNF
jgi:hypothetical protein